MTKEDVYRSGATVSDIQVALAYLMSRHSMVINLKLKNECPVCITKGVVQHLQLIIGHPDIQSRTVLKSTYESLLENWEMILLNYKEQQHVDASTQAQAPSNRSALLH